MYCILDKYPISCLQRGNEQKSTRSKDIHWSSKGGYYWRVRRVDQLKMAVKDKMKSKNAPHCSATVSTSDKIQPTVRELAQE